MKRTIFGFVIAAVIVTAGFLFSYAPAPPPGPAGLVSTKYGINGQTSGGVLAWTVLDTVSGATVDTVTASFTNNPTSITFTNDVLKCAGTPTVTIACYVSANGGVTYDPTPVSAYTVYPTSLTAPSSKQFIVNSAFGRNPETKYCWAIANSASSTASIKYWVLAR